MKIASVFLGMPVGGAEDLALGLSRSLLPRGIETHFVCLRSLDLLGEEMSRTKIPITCLPVAQNKRYSLRGLGLLSEWLTKNKIDLVHSHTYHAHTYAIPAAARAGIPALLHHHKTMENMKWHRWWTMRSLTRKARRVLALSKKTETDLRSAFSLPAGKVLALPNAVNEAEFFPVDAATKNQIRRTKGVDSDAFLFVTVASLQEVKNHSLLLQAIQLATRDTMGRLPGEPKSEFYFLGEGPQRMNLEKAIQELPCPACIHLPGPQRPIAPWLQCADAFILPSKWEGQSLAVLQAIRCGLPVLASRIEGNTALLGRHHPGLFDPSSPAELALLLGKYSSDSRLKTQILEHQGALPLPSWAHLVNQMEAIYRSASAKTQEVTRS